MKNKWGFGLVVFFLNHIIQLFEYSDNKQQCHTVKNMYHKVKCRDLVSSLHIIIRLV